MALQQGVHAKEEKVKGKVIKDRMHEDKEFLRGLKGVFGPLTGVGEANEKHKLREKMRSEVGKAVDFLDAREEFWKQIG